MAKTKGLSEDELATICQREEEDSVGYYNSDIADSQEEALKYYFGENFGDEAEGRSQLVSYDVRETVEWTMPDLARIFMQGDTFEVEPDAAEAVEHAKQATKYLNHVFHRDNPGFELWQDWAKDGLIQKIGVMEVEWKEPDWLPPEEHHNMNILQMEQLREAEAAEKVEIHSVKERECDDEQHYPGGVCYDVRFSRMEEYGHPVISGVAPEEFLIQRAAKSKTDADYMARRFRRTLSDIIEEHPEHADTLLKDMPGDDDIELDARRNVRFGDEEYWDETQETPLDDSSRVVIYLNEYIKVDYDGDGIAELRNVRRVGRHILYNEEVDEDGFADWCPVRVPHKFYGLSQADDVMPLQRAKSVVWRAAMDGMLQAVTPQKLVRDGKVNVNDLMTNRAGGNIRVDGSYTGPLQDAVQPLVIPDVSKSAYPMMEVIEQELEGRTGISRHNQGMDPDALNKTATGIQLIQNASNARKEMVARNMAIGLEKLGNKLLKMLRNNENAARVIKIADGEYAPIDPSQWDHRMSVKVNVGLGTGSREAQMAILANILGLQERIMTAAGGEAPILGWPEVYETATEYVRIAGYKQQFFRDPKNVEPEEPQPDPEIVKAQMQAQTEQQKAQMQMQMEQYKADIQAQMDQAKAQLEGELQAAKIQADRDAAILKYQEEMQQLEAELGLKWQMFVAEMQMKERMHDQEMSLRREQGYVAEQGKIEQARIKTDVQTGGEPG